MIVIGFVVLAVGGTLARVLIGHVFNRPDAPIGTLTVNVVGAFLLGLLVGAGASTDTLTVVGAGALGSFTTFSALSHETAWMMRRHRGRRSLVYLTATVVLGIGAAWLGLVMAG
jgi:CrcB protein